jgi:hypothetical protein
MPQALVSIASTTNVKINQKNSGKKKNRHKDEIKQKISTPKN